MNIKFLALLGAAGILLALIASDESTHSPSGVRADPTPPYTIKPRTLIPAAPPSIRTTMPSTKAHVLYVSGSVVNVREGPKTSYQRLFQLKNGETVREITRSNGWVKVSADGRVGWMHGDYLRAFGTETKKKPEAIKATVKKQASPRCDPNYAGACVPIASDVDCSSGRGNGPAYVRGPVRVIGRDIYRLDGDGDGIGCERG